MLRWIVWLMLLVGTCTAACSAVQEAVVPIAGVPPTGSGDESAPLAGLLSPNVLTLSPDHGKAGDVVIITGTGFGLDPREIRVRIGGAPVKVGYVIETGDGYQQVAVVLNEGTVSGLVSVYAAGRWTTSSGSFCAQPVIRGLALVEADDEATVHIRGSNIDPFAVAYVGEVAREPRRLRSARRPHRIEATQLFIAVQPDEQGTVRVENRCPDGRRHTATSTATFWKSIGN